MSPAVESGYVLAAAVLVWFEPAQIRPISTDLPDDSVGFLLSESVYEEGHWMLRADSRRAALNSLIAKGLIDDALAANPDRPDSDLQRALERALLGDLSDIESQSVAQLGETLQVVKWLDGIVDALPDPGQIRRRLALRDFLGSFDFLVGDHFRGRSDELAKMRAHLFSAEPRLPMLIHAVGGMGKSTLISRFILDTAEEVNFAYIDFDRPGIVANQPLTILIEIARQIGMLHEALEPLLAGLRQKWQRDLENKAVSTEQFTYVQKSVSLEAPVSFEGASIVDAVVEFSAAVHQIIHGRPFLLVLDTFEEVQYRNREFIGDLWELLEHLSGNIPSLRTILAGRVPIEKFETSALPLGELDREAAIAYLAYNKITDAEIANIIVDHLGGNPLSLKLAAQVIQREGIERIRKMNRRGLLQTLDESQIQGYLYRRILNYIHKDEVRRVAHASLVLRRVTHEVIVDVLAAPARILQTDFFTISTIFSELSLEAALMTDDGKGVLKHRADVRAALLPFLKKDRPEWFNQIHRLAVDYYATLYDKDQNADWRAEEIYHLLFVTNEFATIEARWIDGVEKELEKGLEEIPVQFRTQLASRLGREGIGIDWNQADNKSWEARTERVMSDLVARRQFERALDLLNERDAAVGMHYYSPGSRIYLYEAEALMGLERWPAARTVAMLGIDETLKVDAPDLLRDLQLLAVRIHEHLGLYDDALALLDSAEIINTANMQPESSLQQLENHVTRLRLMRLNGQELREAWIEDTVQLFLSTSESELASFPRLLRGLAREVGSENRDVLERIVSIVRITNPDWDQRNQLATAFEIWDSLPGEHQIILSNELKDNRLDPHSESRWFDYVQQVSGSGLTNFMRLIFRYEPIDIVLDAVVELLQGSSEEVAIL